MEWALPGAWYVVASLHSVVLLYFCLWNWNSITALLIVFGVCCIVSVYWILHIMVLRQTHPFFFFIFFVIGKIIAENQASSETSLLLSLTGFGILEFVETGLLYHFNLIKKMIIILYSFRLLSIAFSNFFQLPNPI